MSEEIMAAEAGKPARTLAQVTEEIRYLDTQAKRLMLGHAIEIGRRLKEAKALVPYGGWGDYIRDQLDYSQSTAQNFMRIFDEYGAAQQSIFGPVAESQTLGNLSYTKALKLLAIPESEREAFALEVDAEHLSSRELDQVIRERDEARKKLADTLAESEGASMRLAEAEEQRDAARETVRDLKEREKTFRQELAEAEKELETLRNRPVEVAVQRDEAAIAEAVKQAQDKAAKDLTDARRSAKAAEDAAKKTEKDLRAKITDLENRLAKAKQETAEAPDRERQLAEARAEISALQKKLAMSGAEMAAAKVLFGAWQAAYSRLQEGVANLPEEARDKLRAAVKAQAAKWAEG